MTARKATTAEVRKSYKDRDCEVRIDRKGHVTFRHIHDTRWLEGRWVSEYRVDGEHSHAFIG